MPFNPLQYPLANMPPRLVSPFSNWLGHVPFAFALVQMARPRSVVELGVLQGDSYCAFCQAVAALQYSAQCRGIDLWPTDPQAGFNGEEMLAALRQFHDPEFGRFSQLIRTHFQQAAAQFPDGTVDLLHLDGQPSYAALKQDLAVWLPKLSPRAIVLLHGTNLNVQDGGAKKLWAELSNQNRPSFAFEHAGGLGVLATGTQTPPAVLEFLNDARSNPQVIRAHFARLGEAIELLQQQRRTANVLIHAQAGINDWKSRAGHWVDPKGIDMQLANADTTRFADTVAEQVRFIINDDLATRAKLAAPVPSETEQRPPAQSFSVIICSVDNAKFAEVEKMYRRLLGESAQIIRIPDARGMCEGYNRGIAQSTGDVLIFSHDDIEILSNDFAPILLGHLQNYDLIGVAGTTRLVAGHWVAAGPPYLFGQVPEPSPQGGFVIQYFGGFGRVCPDIQALDGLMFAARRAVVDKIKFDQSFDGFHLYDLDFTFTAHNAGFKLAVARDLFVLHASSGNFDNRWKHYSDLFQRKWAGKLQPHPNRQFHNCIVQVKSKDQIVEAMKLTL
jgi:GT2 family glycosyltransferase